MENLDLVENENANNKMNDLNRRNMTILYDLLSINKFIT